MARKDDIPKIENMIDSALNNDFEFFNQNFNELINQDLLQKVSSEISKIKDFIYDFQDMKDAMADYQQDNPTRDDIVGNVSDKRKGSLANRAWGEMDSVGAEVLEKY